MRRAIERAVQMNMEGLIGSCRVMERFKEIISQTVQVETYHVDAMPALMLIKHIGLALP